MSCTWLDSAWAGDVNDVREVVLTGGPADLANLLVGGSVVGKVWPEGDLPSTAVDLNAVIADPARKIIRVSFGGVGGWLDTATRGTYELHYKVTLNDGSTLTFPSGEPDRINVRE